MKIKASDFKGHSWLKVKPFSKDRPIVKDRHLVKDTKRK